VTLSLSAQSDERQLEPGEAEPIRRLSAERVPLRIISADASELAAHRSLLDAVASRSGGQTIWKLLEE
jgi:hypothetical protein